MQRDTVVPLVTGVRNAIQSVQCAGVRNAIRYFSFTIGVRNAIRLYVALFRNRCSQRDTVILSSATGVRKAIQLFTGVRKAIRCFLFQSVFATRYDCSSLVSTGVRNAIQLIFRCSWCSQRDTAVIFLQSAFAMRYDCEFHCNRCSQRDTIVRRFVS